MDWTPDYTMYNGKICVHHLASLVADYGLTYEQAQRGDCAKLHAPSPPSCRCIEDWLAAGGILSPGCVIPCPHVGSRPIAQPKRFLAWSCIPHLSGGGGHQTWEQACKEACDHARLQSKPGSVCAFFVREVVL